VICSNQFNVECSEIKTHRAVIETTFSIRHIFVSRTYPSSVVKAIIVLYVIKRDFNKAERHTIYFHVELIIIYLQSGAFAYFIDLS
jgi:hypothetical protein